MNNLQIQYDACKTNIINVLLNKTLSADQMSQAIVEGCIPAIDEATRQISSVTLTDFLDLNASRFIKGGLQLGLIDCAAQVVNGMVRKNSYFAMPTSKNIMMYYNFGLWTTLATDFLVYGFTKSVLSAHSQAWESFKRTPKKLDNLVTFFNENNLELAETKIYLCAIAALMASTYASKKICNRLGYNLTWKDVGKLAVASTISSHLVKLVWSF